jgi:hypothetical protein
MKYVPELDHGGSQALKHPGWPEFGWLAWWECPHCWRVDFCAVTARRVRDWGRLLGGWRPRW